MNRRDAIHATIEALLNEAEAAGADFGDFNVAIEFLTVDKDESAETTTQYKAELIEVPGGETHVEDAWVWTQVWTGGADVKHTREDLDFNISAM